LMFDAVFLAENSADRNTFIIIVGS